MKHAFFRVSLLCAAAAGLLLACATTDNGPIPADLSPAKFFQITQELVDQERWDDAERYLAEFRVRYQDSQESAIRDKLLEGEYLNAQILYKRGKLPEALAAYQAVLAKYEGVSEKAVSPPQWIRVLCKRMVETINRKLPAPSASPAVNPAK